jgi:hypothetical protein
MYIDDTINYVYSGILVYTTLPNTFRWVMYRFDTNFSIINSIGSDTGAWSTIYDMIFSESPNYIGSFIL